MEREKVSKLYVERAFDSRSIYSSLNGNAIIPTRKNYSMFSMDSPYRGRITREIRTSESEWKSNNNYEDSLWKLYFSGLKSVMGEIIKAGRPEYTAQEIAMKVHYYNILRQMKEAY